MNNDSAAIGSLQSNAASSSVVLGYATLTVGGDNTSTTFAGVISGAQAGGIGAALTKQGTGVLTLSNVNTFNGPTTISAGAIQIANLNALPNSAVVVNVDYGLTFAVNTANLGVLSGTGNIVMANGASPITLSIGGGNGNSTYSGALSDGGTGSSLVKTGSGTLVAAGT